MTWYTEAVSIWLLVSRDCGGAVLLGVFPGWGPFPLCSTSSLQCLHTLLLAGALLSEISEQLQIFSEVELLVEGRYCIPNLPQEDVRKMSSFCVYQV